MKYKSLNIEYENNSYTWQEMSYNRFTSKSQQQRMQDECKDFFVDEILFDDYSESSTP